MGGLNARHEGPGELVRGDALVAEVRYNKQVSVRPADHGDAIRRRARIRCPPVPPDGPEQEAANMDKSNFKQQDATSADNDLLERLADLRLRAAELRHAVALPNYDPENAILLLDAAGRSIVAAVLAAPHDAPISLEQLLPEFTLLVSAKDGADTHTAVELLKQNPDFEDQLHEVMISPHDQYGGELMGTVSHRFYHRRQHVPLRTWDMLRERFRARLSPALAYAQSDASDCFTCMAVTSAGYTEGRLDCQRAEWACLILADVIEESHRNRVQRSAAADCDYRMKEAVEAYGIPAYTINRAIEAGHIITNGKVRKALRMDRRSFEHWRRSIYKPRVKKQRARDNAIVPPDESLQRTPTGRSGRLEPDRKKYRCRECDDTFHAEVQRCPHCPDGGRIVLELPGLASPRRERN